MNIINRFWSKVLVLGSDDCWNWNSKKDRHGYGTFYIVDRKYVGAHRFSWMLANNLAIDSSVSIRHRCNNPSCVNPKHLIHGTQKENQIDMALSGRQHLQKLSKDDVLVIRSMFEQGVSKSLLASQYNVTRDNIHAIVIRRSWQHL